MKQRIKNTLIDWNYIFYNELSAIFRDQGVLIFCLVLPLVYPLLYAYIYDNEVVREVPAIVVDQNNSSLSRAYLRNVDATPDVKIVGSAYSLQEAREIIGRREAYGIIHIPKTFSRELSTGGRTQVQVFVDMSSMMYYSAILTANMAVSLSMNAKIKAKRIPVTTIKEEQIYQRPVRYEAVNSFNPQGGYASSLLAPVLILILQQTLLLGIGLTAGTAREQNSYGELVPINRHYKGLLRIIIGKAMAFVAIYLWNTIWLFAIVPHLFSLPQLASPVHIWMFAIPYLLAVIFFGMTCSVLFRQREATFMIFVFTSLILLFLSGVEWPKEALPAFWHNVSLIFPSTFGVQAFVKMNSMGADIPNLAYELRALWIQVVVYFFATIVVYTLNIRLSHRRYLQRKNEILKSQYRLRLKKQKA